ncbi:MAG: glycosyltransferase family 2 protein [Nitrospirae bacterium]|nr:glycosyltransferase family 2 protein [Nitrospirota bacterium]
MNISSYGRDSASTPFLSIVVPAFNEEQRLPDTLVRAAAFVEGQVYAAELIVVDNASTDRSEAIVKEFASRYPFIRYLYEPKKGKGAAVRTGMLAARGEYQLISDADMSVPLEEVRNFLPPRLEGYDIAIASREADGAKRYGEPFHRHAMGRVFNLLVQLLLLPGIRDTQCGFKCFSRDCALDLFTAGKVSGWSFDAEVLYIARLRGYKIVEVPVNWYFGESSKVNPLRDIPRMIREIAEIRRNGDKGLYGKSARAGGRETT